MKKIAFTIMLLVIAAATFGQSSLPKGRTQLNAGVGLSTWGIPVYFGFDHSVHQDITLGAEVSARGYREDWKKDRYKHNIIGIHGNANYHFNTIFHIPSNWDLYAGANIGFFIWDSPFDYPGNRASGLGLGGQIGGRYFFNKTFGFNLELGSGNAFSGGKFGMTFRL